MIAADLGMEVITSDCLLTVPGALDNIAEFAMLEILLRYLLFPSAVLVEILLSDRKGGMYTPSAFAILSGMHLFSSLVGLDADSCIMVVECFYWTPLFIDLIEDSFIQQLLESFQVCLNIKSPCEILCSKHDLLR